MEQIVPLINQIVTAQNFLKSNYLTLNEYWIKPRVGLSLSPSYCSDKNIELQIDQSIGLIDKNLCEIIQIITEINLFDQILESSTFDELKCLDGITFGLIIPKELEPLVLSLEQLEPIELVNQIIELATQLKNTFGYKFLDLLTEKLIIQIIHSYFHVKKLYLEYYKKTNET
jgi:hypothetical protein